MAENIKLYAMQCPACKSPIEGFTPFKASAKCPVCGTVIENPHFKIKDADIPTRMIPFSSQEGDFEQALINALINQDYVPKDIFEAINTDDVYRTYLPMYLYEGTYQASWNCESSYMDQKVTISSNWTDSGKTVSTKEVKKWRPQNGNAAGNFAFLCLANEGEQSVPEELRNFTKQFPYDVMLSKEFNGELLSEEDERLVTVSRNADPAIVWQKYGKGLVDQTAEKAARSQVGNQEIRNFRTTSSCHLTTKGDYLLVPFWFVYYSYNNNRYSFMMDGTGQHCSYTYPTDPEEVDFVNKKNRVKKIVSWLWLIAVLFLFIFGWATGLITFGVWLVSKLIVDKVMNKQIQKHLDESRDARREAAAKLS